MRKKHCVFTFLLLTFLTLCMGCSKETEEISETIVETIGETVEEAINDPEIEILEETEAEPMAEPSPEELARAKKREALLQSDQGKSMTLMVYMVGSDLEAATAAATNDMTEMIESGVDLSKVRLLVYTGGSPKWHNPNIEIPIDQHTVYELTEAGFVKVTDFDAMSMGDPTSLNRFLKYGYENYPSETFGLILWNHGNGPVMGYGSDLLYNKDAMTLPEIGKALSESPFHQQNKLSFIGFDACLMASAELACVVDDYAEYLIASQEVEPGFGWNYDVLKYCGKTDIPTFVQLIVEDYIAYSNDYFAQNTFFQSEVTLAAVDLSYASQLEAAIDRLFGAAASNVSEEFQQLAFERVGTRAFGRATTGSEYDLVDIRALMNAMGDSYDDESEEILDILDNMVIYSDSNTVESCGLSLYYPYYNKKYYEASWKDSYAELGLFPNYLKYLQSYGEIWLGTDMKEYFGGRLVASDAGSGTYTLQLNQAQNEHFADAGFYILRQMGEDGYSIIYYSNNVTNEEGLLTAKFDGNVLYYGNDLGFKGIPVTRALDELDGKTRYIIFPTLTGAVKDFAEFNNLMCQIVVSVDEETKEVSVLDFSESSSDEIQTGKRPQVNLDDWVRIEFYELRSRYLTRDEDGRIMDYWNWPEGTWIIWNEMSLADGLNFTYEPIYDDGEQYFLMFDVMDVQGNRYSSELFPITLEEAPVEEIIPPTDAGTLEENTALIFDREGVQLYLDLIQDSSLGQTSYCFRAENSNDYPVRIYIDDMLMNETISCTDTSAYLSIEPNSVDFNFMTEISQACMLEDLDHPKQLTFKVRMNNELNDKTLIHNEYFQLSISDTAQPKRLFWDLLDARAEEQVLIKNAADSQLEKLQVTLLGAGYELNRDHSAPDSDYAEFQGILKVENVSDETQTVFIHSIDINGKPQSTDSFFSICGPERTLAPGQIYVYTWNIYKDDLLDQSIKKISDVVIQMTTTSEHSTTSYSLKVALADE